MNSDYLIEFQPSLLEEAVTRAIANHPRARIFWRERERLYERANREDGESAFREFHKAWFQRLGLISPLQKVFCLWPILTAATARCLFVRARAPKSIGAELYVAAEASGLNERDHRTIVVQLTPEMLTQARVLLEFLRHEFLHIVDMLDPHFGYEPDFPRSDAGPAYDHLLQSRYGVLWDATIDGRLYQKGWLPISIREKHFANFKRAFQGSEAKLAQRFAYFFDQDSHTHGELVEFAQHPERWLAGEELEIASKGRCALCYSPTFLLVSPDALARDLRVQIQQDFPAWNPAQAICQQCVDLYEARIYMTRGRTFCGAPFIAAPVQMKESSAM
jgi:hypothetical protein